MGRPVRVHASSNRAKPPQTRKARRPTAAGHRELLCIKQCRVRWQRCHTIPCQGRMAGGQSRKSCQWPRACHRRLPQQNLPGGDILTSSRDLAKLAQRAQARRGKDRAIVVGERFDRRASAAEMYARGSYLFSEREAPMSAVVLAPHVPGLVLACPRPLRPGAIRSQQWSLAIAPSLIRRGGLIRTGIAQDP
jgi:hypothetical protein